MLSNIDNAVLDNFDHVEHLVSFIRRTWDAEGLAPRGFAARKADFDGIDPHAAQEQASSFTGINDNSATGFRFPVACSLEHVTYSDVNQGRDPLETLIGACVGYGMRIEEERSRRKVEKAFEQSLACVEVDKKNAQERNDDVEARCAGYGKIMLKLAHSLARL